MGKIYLGIILVEVILLRDGIKVFIKMSFRNVYVEDDNVVIIYILRFIF